MLIRSRQKSSPKSVFKNIGRCRLQNPDSWTQPGPTPESRRLCAVSGAFFFLSSPCLPTESAVYLQVRGEVRTAVHYVWRSPRSEGGPCMEGSLGGGGGGFMEVSTAHHYTQPVH